MTVDVKPILLVEDDPHDVELIVTALEQAKIANPLEVARDGVEALDYLFGRVASADRPKVLPAVILLDVKMPKVNGLEVLRKVKSDDELSTIPVVMLTSSREESDVVESYRYGVNAYVVKPVDFGDFAEAVATIGLFWAVINQPPPPPEASERVPEIE